MTGGRFALIGIAISTCVWSTEIHYQTVSPEVVEARLKALPLTNGARHDAVRRFFEEAGCADHLNEQPVKHSKNANVICTLPGTTEATIIVGAHFDFINAGTGAIDNWSGAALLATLYQSLKSVPRKHTFVFIGFTDEESGLVGSKFYVNHLDKSERAQIAAMVNIDSLGSSPTKFEKDRADKRLGDALIAVATSFKLPLSIVNVHKVGMSDSDSFQDQRIPAVCLHSITQETFPLLHTRRDQLSAIHEEEYYDSYRLTAAFLAYLDDILEASVP